MKKTILYIFLLVSVVSFAQTKGITYQAVIYNPEMGQLPGQNNKLSPLANAAICMSFEIDNVNSATSVYTETINTTTDAYGMINLIIGSGARIGGSAASFETIKWDQNVGDLIVSVDLSGNCSAYVEISRQPFTAVPFSLAAGVSTGGEVADNKSDDINADGDSDVKYPTVKAVKEYVDNSMLLVIADATPSLKGLIQLKGDLSGTAALPTVPGLLLKAPLVSPAFTGTVTGIDKTMVGLPNVNNTADADKPVSIAVQAAIDGKVTVVTGFGLSAESYSAVEKTKLAAMTGTNTGDQDLSSYATGANLNLKEATANKSVDLATDVKYPSVNAVKTYVDAAVTNSTIVDANAITKGKIQLAGDLAGTAALPTVPGLALKAPLNAPVFTGTVGGITQAMVGLSIVDNTRDLDKPISNSAQTSLDTKINSIDKAAPNGVATLDVLGKIPNNQMPALRLSAAYVAANESAMLGLADAIQGDVAIRTDSNKTYILTDSNFGLASSWIELLSPLVPNEQDPTFNASASARIVDADLQNWNNKQNNLGYTAENRTNKSTNVIADATSDDKYPSVNAIKTYVDTQIFSGSITDADATTKGKIQLAGDLAGTAALPTVPGLALKAPLNAPVFTGTVGGITQAMVGLSSVDNTRDLDKPISNSAQTALDTKINSIDKAAPNGVATLDVLGKIPNNQMPALRLSSTYVAANESAMLGLADAIQGDVAIRNDVNKTYILTDSNFGSTSSWIELLSPLVPNEQDPTFNASASARIVDVDLQNWNNKQNNLGYTAENRTNKSTNVIADAISDDKYPSVNAVKTYVDAAVTNATIVDANAITKGKIQLAGDLSGTAALPTVPGLVLKAPLASPAFTGTVTGIDKTMVGLSNVNNTADADKVISNATQTALSAKVDAVTGMGLSAESYSAEEKTKLATITGTNTGDQDLTDLATNSDLDLKAPLASPAFTGTVTGIDKAMVGLSNVNNTADADKAISTATQTALSAKVDAVTGMGLSAESYSAEEKTKLATITGTNTGDQDLTDLATNSDLDLKAPLASPAFTGTVTGITSTMVGLSNVNNTADADKVISNATQTALSAKVDAVTGMGLSAESYSSAEKNKLVAVTGTNTGDQDLTDLATKTNLDLKAPLASPAFTGTVTGIDKAMVGLSNVDDTADADKVISNATQTALSAKVDAVAGMGLSAESFSSAEKNKLVAVTGTNTGDQDLTDLATKTNLDLKAPLASPAFTGTVTGITSTMVGLSNVNNTADADKVISNATQTALSAKVDAVAGMGLSAESFSSAEKNKLAAVTGTNTGDQDLTALATKTNLDLKAPLASPAFTGTVTGIDKAMVGLSNVNNTADADKVISNATQTALSAKVDVVAGMGLSAESYSADEKNKLAAVTGTNTGDQDLTALATKTNLDLKAPLASPAFTGTVTGITSTMVGLSNVNNTADADKAISTLTQTALSAKVDVVSGMGLSAESFSSAEKTKLAAVTGTNTGDQDLTDLATKTNLDLKAPLASPAFTGTVTGIDKAMVGLSNVNNTADADKAISTLTQTALSAKVDVVAGMGLSAESYSADEKNKLAAVTGTNTGDQDLTDLATKTNLDLKAPLASPAFTGTVTGITSTMVGLSNVNNTADADKVISNATQTALSAKVDVVAGMGLSAESFSSAEKNKLAAVTGTNTGDQDLTALATKSYVDGKSVTAANGVTVVSDVVKLGGDLTAATTIDQKAFDLTITGTDVSVTKLNAAITKVGGSLNAAGAVYGSSVYRNTATSYTISPTDYFIVNTNGDNTPVTFTLPMAAAEMGRTLIIANMGSGPVGFQSGALNATVTFTTIDAGFSGMIIFDGLKWMVL
jgi:hypothetical protein